MTDRDHRSPADRPGAAAAPLTAHLAGRLADGAAVLDLHAGAGREALALARDGCRVTCLHPSAEVLAEVERLAGAGDLRLDLHRSDFRDYVPDEPFDAVLAVDVLSGLPRQAAASLLHRLRAWTRPRGLVALSALHVDDPGYDEVARGWRRIGLHSFRSGDGRYRTYLGRGEILDLMLGWSVLHHHETPARPGPAGGPGLVELVAARPEGPP